jgi:hypothetical protein
MEGVYWKSMYRQWAHAGVASQAEEQRHYEQRTEREVGITKKIRHDPVGRDCSETCASP